MNSKLEDVIAESSRFRARFSTLVMATVSKDGVPEASYAPYVMDEEGVFFVYLSDLSRHTANLWGTGRFKRAVHRKRGD